MACKDKRRTDLCPLPPAENFPQGLPAKSFTLLNFCKEVGSETDLVRFVLGMHRLIGQTEIYQTMEFQAVHLHLVNSGFFKSSDPPGA